MLWSLYLSVSVTVPNGSVVQFHHFPMSREGLGTVYQSWADPTEWFLGSRACVSWIPEDFLLAPVCAGMGLIVRFWHSLSLLHVCF